MLQIVDLEINEAMENKFNRVEYNLNESSILYLGYNIYVGMRLKLHLTLIYFFF